MTLRIFGSGEASFVSGTGSATFIDFSMSLVDVASCTDGSFTLVEDSGSGTSGGLATIMGVGLRLFVS